MNTDLLDDFQPLHFFKLFFSDYKKNASISKIVSRQNESICTDKDQSSQPEDVKMASLGICDHTKMCFLCL